jgi:polysaccharide deacetylase family protein (PEP-CTERM system associated)
VNRINAFSVDVEDGISIAMRDRFARHVPQTERVVSLTRRILELLERHDVKGTFFVLGQVAEVFPELVREIHAGGHEIGVHGYDHHVFHKLTRAQAREELHRAKSILEDLTGERVAGHRAPCFSIDRSTAWTLDLLLDLGYEYDSSIMPCAGVGYGWPGQRLDIGPISTPGGRRIIEVPLSVVKIAGRNVPALGGSYLRLFPFAISRWMFEKVEEDRPAIVYVHPYEIDPEPYPAYYLQELRNTSLKTRVRMRSAWLRRKSMLDRCDRLLSEFQFGPIRSLVKKAGFHNAEN